MSLPSYQELRTNRRLLDTAQSRLAILSYFTEKREGKSFYKKKEYFWDHEHLYSQNLTLRSQIKQLVDANKKAKTRILEMEAEMNSSQLKVSQQGFKESVVRSMSLKSLNRQSLALSRVQSDKEDKFKNARQIVRSLREEISKLKHENSELKRCIKYTRMSEIQALNTEMQVELQRLTKLTNQSKEKYYSLALQFQALENSLKRESDAKKVAIYEKNKIQNQLNKLQKEKQQLQKKSEINERKWQQEIRKAKAMNPQNSVIRAKINYQQLNSLPKLEYSISGLDRVEGDTINFDRLINTDSQLKSIPKISSVTSLEIIQKKTSKHDLNHSPSKKGKETKKEVAKTTEKKKEKPSELQTSKLSQHYEENFEEIIQNGFEEQINEEVQEVKKQPKKEEKRKEEKKEMKDDKKKQQKKEAKKEQNKKQQKKDTKKDEIKETKKDQKKEPKKDQKKQAIKQEKIQVIKKEKTEAKKDQDEMEQYMQEQFKEDSVYQDLFQQIEQA